MSLSFSEAWELLGLNKRQVSEFLEAKSIKLKENWAEIIQHEYSLCQSNSIQLIPFWHPDFPESIKNMQKPPLVISCVGDSKCLTRDSIGVVGSRKLSYSTSLWMEQELSYFIKKSQLAIVSGGAYGADQKAHSLSVLYGRPTLCWLPSGHLNMYPHSLKSLARDIVETKGALVSTYGPCQRMRKFHFVQRNQFIAANSLFSFVVQAKRKSGTLITARAAADIGKEVAVLPSAPNEEGLGGLDLICEGAHLIRDAKDLLALAQSLMSQQVAPLIETEK